MDGGEKKSGRSQDPLETGKCLVDVGFTNVKETERSPQPIKCCWGKVEKPHVHFSNGSARHTRSCELNEALGEINGRHLIT
jgi:hypothetical protein